MRLINRKLCRRVNEIANRRGILKLHNSRTEILRAIRFSLIGVLSALVYAAVSAASYHFAHDMIVATLIGQSGSTIVSYLGHLHFSFAVHPQHRIFLSRFLFVVGVAFVVNIATTWVLSSVLSMPYQISILIVVVLIPFVTYLANRFWVFLPGLAGHDVSPSINAGLSHARERD